MPPIGILSGKHDVSSYFVTLSPGHYETLAQAKAAGAATRNYGVFLGTVVNFLIIALAVVLVVRQINAMTRKPAEQTTPSQRDCPRCLSPVRSRRHAVSSAHSRCKQRLAAALLTVEQVIGVGVLTFDGNGGFTQTTNEKGSLSGIVVPNRSGSGTYTVNSDCSGTSTLNIPGLPFPVVYDFVIADRAREFHAIAASPLAVMVATVGHRRK